MHALAVCLLANRIRCHACYSLPGSLDGPYACSVARSIQYFSAVTTAAAPDSAGPVIAFSRRHRRALCLVVRECCHIHWFASLPYCTGLTLVWSCLVCCGKVDTLVRAHLICYWTLIWTFIFCLMPTDLYGWGWNSVVPGLYYDWEIRSWETRETLPNSAGDDKGQWLDVFTWEIGDTREF